MVGEWSACDVQEQTVLACWVCSPCLLGKCQPPLRELQLFLALRLCRTLQEFIDLYAKLPTDRQRMKFAALQALLEQLGQEDTAPADASHVMTRWVAQQLSG